ncbi:MAG: hypothetical protein PHW62_00800 [Candidatus Ratteibacteria bacterium]|nr:hypothetical protein [Candidatus Ratteibacteria bacterium]
METRHPREIKEAVWKQLVKRNGIPEESRAALDIEETTEDAIETAILMTAQSIFQEIASKQRIIHGTGIVESEDLLKIEDKWLHNACNVCERRLPSVIRRKDGTRICARCEVSQLYTEEEIHGKTGTAED